MAPRKIGFKAVVFWRDPLNRAIMGTTPGPAPNSQTPKRSKGFYSVKQARGFKHYLGKAFRLKAKMVVME